MPSQIAVPKHRLDALTSLRFFAALIVVLFHFGPGIVTLPVLRALISNGYECVGFFFVLSGFVLTYSYFRPAEKNSLSIDRFSFWKSRFARIYPVYALSITLSVPRYLYGIGIGTVPRSEAKAAVWLVPSLMQSWYPPAAGACNLAAWSLSVEAFFYALLPLMLPYIGRWHPGVVMAFSAALELVLDSALAPMIRSAVSARYPGSVPYFPLFHLPTFLAGVALGLFYFRKTNIPRWAGWLSVTALLGIFCFRDLIPKFMVNKFILVPLFLSVIYFTAMHPIRTLQRRTLVLLGDASYSLYMLHIPFGVVFFKHFHGILALGLFLAGIVSLSVVTYLWFEIPMRGLVLGSGRKETKHHTIVTSLMVQLERTESGS